MSERVSHDAVDQKVNGQAFNHNSLVGNFDPAAMNFNGMPFQNNFQFGMNNNLGFGAMNMNMPGQSVSITFNPLPLSAK